MSILLPSIIAFISTLFLIKLVLIFFPKWGLLDRPAKYGIKRAPIPYYGGIVIYLVFSLLLLLFLPIDKHLIGFLSAGSLLVLVSFLDDKFGLSPTLRLFIQFLAALIVVLAGIGITNITNPFGGEINLNQWQIPFNLSGIDYHFTVLADIFTIIWVMGMINTMNWLDGIAGLTSGIAVIAGVTLGTLSLTPLVNQPEIALISFIFAAACSAFWLFDFYPPKLLMGDTGSMFLGFVLAIIGIFSGGKVATAFMVMGFPILDAAWVILRRLKEGRSPFQGDKKHFHHRLLEVGLSERKALLVIYLICLLFGVSALFLTTLGKFIAILLMIFLMSSIGFFLIKREKKNQM